MLYFRGAAVEQYGVNVYCNLLVKLGSLYAINNWEHECTWNNPNFRLHFISKKIIALRTCYYSCSDYVDVVTTLNEKTNWLYLLLCWPGDDFECYWLGRRAVIENRYQVVPVCISYTYEIILASIQIETSFVQSTYLHVCLMFTTNNVHRTSLTESSIYSSIFRIYRSVEKRNEYNIVPHDKSIFCLHAGQTTPIHYHQEYVTWSSSLFR